MPVPNKSGACDCHSHVFGRYATFPLSPQRTFDPPESPIENLERVWETVGIDRAVLVQGSAHGEDHSALLAAIQRAPQSRRGVALLQPDVPDDLLAALHLGGVRAVRFNWIRHLLGSDPRSKEEHLADAAKILERVAPFGWHVEVHIDAVDLDLIARLSLPADMPIVIDHMARIDLSGPTAASELDRLLQLLQRESTWVKISGADRLTVKLPSLEAALEPMRRIVNTAPERCIWGLDWPHVNLSQKRSDATLKDLLLEVAGDEVVERVLVHNPAQLYGFDAQDVLQILTNGDR